MTGLSSYPPPELRERVFASGEGSESTALYEETGSRIASAIEAGLPKDWNWRDKRVLDFGSGAGRVARHLSSRHRDAEIFACDVHTPSVDWMNAHLASDITAFACAADPPLELPDDYFDVVYGISAFTHIGWNWAEWISEVHRILRPGGVLFATLVGSSLRRTFFPVIAADDDFGLMVSMNWNPPDRGGPVAAQSTWWRRAHWGRAFEQISYVDDGLIVGITAEALEYRQSIWVGRARPGHYSAATLAALAEDPRETAGLVAANQVLRAEIAWLAARGQPE